MGNSGSSGSSSSGSVGALEEARKKHKNITNEIYNKNKELLRLKDKNLIEQVTGEIDSLQEKLKNLNQKHVDWQMKDLNSKATSEKKRVVKGMILGETLGKGTFGYVKMGYHEKTGRQCAMKFLLKNSRGYRREEVLTEIACLKLINHKNVVALYGSWMSVDYPARDGNVEEAVLMMLEYCPGGDLYEIVYYTGKLEEKLVRTYTAQLMAGLYAIHSVGVTHRDIKPNNILLDHRFQLKITDFGLSGIYQGDNPDAHRMPASQAWMGTKGFQAPEQILNRPYSNLVDIFATGVCIFMLLGAKQPFKKAASNDPWFRCVASKAYKKFWKAHGKEKFSEEVKDLLNGMLAYQPKDRSTIFRVANHPWVTGDKYDAEQLYDVMRKLHLKTYEKKMKDDRRQQRMMQSYDAKNQKLGAHRAVGGTGEREIWASENEKVEIPEVKTLPFFGVFSLKEKSKPITVMNELRESAIKHDGKVAWDAQEYLLSLTITIASSEDDHDIPIEVKMRVFEGKPYLILNFETWKASLSVDRQIKFFWEEIWTDASDYLDGPYIPKYDDKAFDWSDIDVEGLFDEAEEEEVDAA